MRDRKLASRYARALLAVVRDPAEREAIDGFLVGLATALDGDADLRAALFDPAVSRAARKDALRALAGAARVPGPASSFLEALVDRNRLGALGSIAQVFHELRESEAGVVPARITTATALAPDQLDRVRRALEKLTGSRVRLAATVEPEILGGAVTRVGSFVYDGSLRTQVERLRQQMEQDPPTREAR
jgi:F-type H+-transporting ATPase subunit delta